jgi:uncharacterized membrane protein YfcA
VLIVFGLAIGFIMGIMGAGGGVFIGAFFILFFKMPTKRAIANSILIMAVAALPGLLLHGLDRTTPWDYGVVIVAPSILAAWGGAVFANRIRAETIKRILGVYLVIVSSGLIVKSLF